jgi:hypothetical protein
MNANDVDMCVADTLRDDEIENLDSILQALDHEDGSSWRAARGAAFALEEVKSALLRLIDAGHVTPCAERPPVGECLPVSKEQIGKTIAWDGVWFHLEPAGREAVDRWWETEGRVKYPRVL